jgi:hypothetical protein
MAAKWIAEVFKHGSFKKRRVFRTVEQAVAFANDWHDSHYGCDVQIITPSGRIHQTNTNGNQSAASIIADEARKSY